MPPPPPGGRPLKPPPLPPPQEVAPYKDVKLFSDTVIGVPSQCFVAGKAGVGAGNFPKGGLVGVRVCVQYNDLAYPGSVVLMEGIAPTWRKSHSKAWARQPGERDVL